MSMYRQLWLAIIVSTLLALGGSLLASMLSARAYLEQQLTMKNEDNASALALSLSQQKPDAVTVELAVAALFDSGHYESIEVIDPNGKSMIKRATEINIESVPTWFVRQLPINAAAGQAQISSGWTQFGTVVLKSNSSFAYDALWQSALEMILAVSIAGLIGGYLGSLILQRLKTPLDAVINQAQAITAIIAALNECFNPDDDEIISAVADGFAVAIVNVMERGFQAIKAEGGGNVE